MTKTGALREPSGSPQEVLREPSGSPQEVLPISSNKIVASPPKGFEEGFHLGPHWRYTLNKCIFFCLFGHCVVHRYSKASFFSSPCLKCKPQKEPTEDRSEGLNTYIEIWNSHRSVQNVKIKKLFPCNVLVRALQYFQKNLDLDFANENKKKRPHKLHIIGPNYFFSTGLAA